MRKAAYCITTAQARCVDESEYGITCNSLAAGTYRITILKPPGYQAIESCKVTPDERKLIEKVVQIVRE